MVLPSTYKVLVHQLLLSSSRAEFFKLTTNNDISSTSTTVGPAESREDRNRTPLPTTMDIFKAAIATYLEDAQLSDFTIVCGDTEYNVHRVIISAHSKYFARCCSGDFEEAMTRRVVLQEDDPAAIARMYVSIRRQLL